MPLQALRRRTLWELDALEQTARQQRAESDSARQRQQACADQLLQWQQRRQATTGGAAQQASTWQALLEAEQVARLQWQGADALLQVADARFADTFSAIQQLRRQVEVIDRRRSAVRSQWLAAEQRRQAHRFDEHCAQRGRH